MDSDNMNPGNLRRIAAARKRLKDNIGQLSDEIEQSSREFSAAISGVGNFANQASRTAAGVRSTIREHPLLAIGGAAFAGWMVSRTWGGNNRPTSIPLDAYRALRSPAVPAAEFPAGQPEITLKSVLLRGLVTAAPILLDAFMTEVLTPPRRADTF